MLFFSVMSKSRSLFRGVLSVRITTFCVGYVASSLLAVCDAAEPTSEPQPAVAPVVKPAEIAPKTNFVIILSDDMGISNIGCYRK